MREPGEESGYAGEGDHPCRIPESHGCVVRSPRFKPDTLRPRTPRPLPPRCGDHDYHPGFTHDSGYWIPS